MSLRHIAPLSRTSVHYLQRWATYCTVCTKRVLAFLSLSIAQPSQRHCKNVNWNIGQVRVLPLRLRVCFRDVAPGDRPQAPPLAKHVAAVSCEPVHCVQSCIHTVASVLSTPRARPYTAVQVPIHTVPIPNDAASISTLIAHRSHARHCPLSPAGLPPSVTSSTRRPIFS
jgi:hypothetical protein